VPSGVPRTENLEGRIISSAMYLKFLNPLDRESVETGYDEEKIKRI
jgi:hypothetical protein